jgi:hypothetical protein
MRRGRIGLTHELGRFQSRTRGGGPPRIVVFMPRKGRVEFAGAVYHVLDRGDRREAIVRDDTDREDFLSTLGKACERTGWYVHTRGC